MTFFSPFDAISRVHILTIYLNQIWHALLPIEKVFVHTFKCYETDYQVEHSILIPNVLSFRVFQVGQSNNKT